MARQISQAQGGLRVIGGRYRSRRLLSLPGEATRPMLGRMRETLFNVLQGQVEDRVFADLYAGTGAVGIEALSRGARQVIFVESNPAAVEIIRKNLASVGAREESRIIFSPVAAALPGLHADVAFVGPPYPALEEYQQTLDVLGKTPPGLVAVQHARALALGESYYLLQRYRTISMGRNALSFFRPKVEPDQAPGE